MLRKRSNLGRWIHPFPDHGTEGFSSFSRKFNTSLEMSLLGNGEKFTYIFSHSPWNQYSALRFTKFQAAHILLNFEALSTIDYLKNGGRKITHSTYYALWIWKISKSLNCEKKRKYVKKVYLHHVPAMRSVRKWFGRFRQRWF